MNLIPVELTYKCMNCNKGYIIPARFQELTEYKCSFCHSIYKLGGEE